jgi:hypothetical protein
MHKTTERLQFFVKADTKKKKESTFQRQKHGDLLEQEFPAAAAADTLQTYVICCQKGMRQSCCAHGLREAFGRPNACFILAEGFTSRKPPARKGGFVSCGV